jgi:oligoribonuclease NrnB/cAMP/cGMP phosphodiesterase (DHH superfamily)
MIKGINQGGRYITVTGGMPGSNYINNYSGAQGIGNMRFNTSTQNVEVWDGNNWMTLQTSYATVQLDSEAISLLDWAKENRDEEWKMQELIKTNPAVKIAYDNVLKAQEQLKITTILSTDEKTTS